jgi:hypothetical protein
MSENNKEILKSLIQAQSEFKPIPQNGSVNFQGRNFKYAELSDILSTVAPTLRKNGLLLNHKIISGPTGSDDNLITTLSHAPSGETICTEFSIPKCAKAQDAGGWITYGRRYSMEMLLGVCSEEDTDGPKNDHATYTTGPKQGPSPKAPAGNFQPTGPNKISSGGNANQATKAKSMSSAFESFGASPGRLPAKVGPVGQDTSFNFGPMSQEDDVP